MKKGRWLALSVLKGSYEFDIKGVILQRYMCYTCMFLNTLCLVCGGGGVCRRTLMPGWGGVWG